MALRPRASVARITVINSLSIALCSFFALFNSYNLIIFMCKSKLYWNEEFILHQKYVSRVSSFSSGGNAYNGPNRIGLFS